MQIMAEALGLALPGSALMPATSPDLLDYAKKAGKQAVRLAQMEHMRPSDIVTMDSFENAIMVHAAISGIYQLLCCICRPLPMNLALRLTGDTFDQTAQRCTVTFWMYVRLDRWPAECFYYAGGVPAIMEEIKEHASSGCDDGNRKDVWEKIWKI